MALIYFNDTRHDVLYIFEPPIAVEQIQRQVDIPVAAGAQVLVFHVGDWGVYQPGLFYNTNLGFDWCGDDGTLPLRDGDWWRAWMNLRSLRERGLDLLTILIDRAHKKGVEIHGSLRMNHGYAPIDPQAAIGGEDQIIEGEAPWVSGATLPPIRVPIGMPAAPTWCPRSQHADYAHPEVRRRCLAIVDELTRNYALDGIELDFAITPFYFRPQAVRENTTLMTEHVREISKRVGRLTARVFPTEQLNLNAGLDVRTWINEQLIHHCVPMCYGLPGEDAQSPFDWLVDLGVPVYPMLDPAPPQVLRGAAAVAQHRGADGVYAWKLDPRQITALAGEDTGAKRYVFQAVDGPTAVIYRHLGYQRPLPIRLEARQEGQMTFYFVDKQPRTIELAVVIANLVTQDVMRVALNGQNLESCLRGRTINSYRDMTLHYDLTSMAPHQGANTLTFALTERPRNLVGTVTVEQVRLDTSTTNT